MRLAGLFAVLAITAAGSGCSLVYMGIHDIDTETKSELTHHRLASRAQKQAKAAWQDVVQATPGAAFSADYRCGFLSGYVRAVWWGPEDPPVIPPRVYWSPRYQNTDGRQAIEDWNMGFRHGVGMAEQTGAASSMKLPGPQSSSSPPHAAAGQAPGDSALT